MATAEQLKALVESFQAGDSERFRTIALQIAARSAQQGKTKLAAELQALVERLPRQQSGGPVVPLARPPKNLSGLLSASYPETHLSEMVLSSDLRKRLERVVVEYRQRELLRAHGLRPKQRLLLVGPPGCGKTMTAAALAGECHLPLMVVQLHSLITRYMGETAAQLHQVFEAIERTPGVYLFDEFDAIGAIRSAQNDVGEIRRVLNSFLQFLETVNSNSIVVAATNLVDLLDQALFRRFDVVLNYALPSEPMVRDLILNRLGPFATPGIDWTAVSEAAKGLSHAEVVRASEEAAKDAILAEESVVRSEILVNELMARKDIGEKVR
jgi:SpoVK/Ycf46/Vps4 family AAA+-type ATPase